MRDKGETSVGDKRETRFKIMYVAQDFRVQDKCGRQWETRVNSCGPGQPEWKTSVEDECGTGRQV